MCLNWHTGGNTLEIIQGIIYVLLTALSIWCMAMIVFLIFVTFKGYSNKTKDYSDKAPKNKFLIFIPAHNEEKVISGIIQCMEKMEYPKELFDYYILADNCTDNTAQIARDLGANVFEFFKENEDSPTGKPIALQKAFERIGNYHERYDLVMFFDADNLVDSNMLKEINSQMLEYPDAVATQSYLGAKNKSGIVAAFYYLSYTISNRFFQLAKCRMGLNIAIGGTGFAVRTDYIHNRGGWKAMSLTEDFEFQIETTIDGKRILWNNNVKVLDEKPTSYYACFKQQKRWAQGHWYVAFKNTPNLIQALWHKKISIWEFMSTSFYMYSLIPYFLMTVQIPLLLINFILKISGIYNNTMFDISSLFNINLISVLIFLYLFIFLFYVADYMDNKEKPSIKYLPVLLAGIIMSSAVITVAKAVGLLYYKNQHTWVKTEHKINI